MTITPHNTIHDIITKNGALFALGFSHICDKIKGLDVPKFVPLYNGTKRQNIICRDVLSEITMRELDKVSQMEATTDYFIMVLSLMLRIKESDVPYLQFLGAFRYYMHILDEMSVISEMWKSLEIHDEDSITPNHPDRGLWAIVDDYSDDKHILPNIAWEVPCLEMYLHFEKKHDRYIAEKARLKAQEAGGRHLQTTKYGLKRHY